MLASGSSDKTVRLWDLSTGDVAQKLEGHTNSVTHVVFSSDGSLIASKGWDAIRVWDVSTGMHFYTFGSSSSNIEFSPDGQTLASGNIDWEIQIWEISTGNLKKTWDVPTGITYNLDFSPDGRLLVSDSYGERAGPMAPPPFLNLLFWDVSTGTILFTQELEGFFGVTDVAFSPDGYMVAASLTTPTSDLIVFWGVP
jgi:WD40 repeat protein